MLYISYLNVHSCGLSNCSIKLYYYYYIYIIINRLKHRASPCLCCSAERERVSLSPKRQFNVATREYCLGHGVLDNSIGDSI